MEHTTEVRTGWWLAGLSLLFPFLAIGAVWMGGRAITRHKAGPGVAIIVVAALAATASWFIGGALLN